MWYTDSISDTPGNLAHRRRARAVKWSHYNSLGGPGRSALLQAHSFEKVLIWLRRSGEKWNRLHHWTNRKHQSNGKCWARIGGNIFRYFIIPSCLFHYLAHSSLLRPHHLPPVPYRAEMFPYNPFKRLRNWPQITQEQSEPGFEILDSRAPGHYHSTNLDYAVVSEMAGRKQNALKFFPLFCPEAAIIFQLNQIPTFLTRKSHLKVSKLPI